MKFLILIEEILSEAKRKALLKLTTVFNNQTIDLISTSHQRFDRGGNLNDEQLGNRTSQNKRRLGVQDELIVNIFKSDMNQIINSFGDMVTDRIIFVKPNPQPNNDPNWNFIEFIIGTTNKKAFYIVTSAHSKDGQYLRSTIKPTAKVQLENKNHNKIKIVML